MEPLIQLSNAQDVKRKTKMANQYMKNDVGNSKGKAYCSTCGEWAYDCKTVIVFGSPERVCGECRSSNN
jgi:hypothetical protein